MTLGRSTFSRAVLYAALALAGCAQDPKLVASNCADGKDCAETHQSLHAIDKVDILLVVDNSPSIVSKQKQLKAELPRLLNAIVSGEAEGTSFPPAKSVHVAVTTSDMGVGPDIKGYMSCDATGDDGVLIKPSEAGVSCDTSDPSYLEFEGGPAAIATADSVGCVPLRVVSTDDTNFGCGFEQPLEAGLKALWPASDHDVSFVSGSGHASDENAGFLRADSLLVVVVITDEDDCSSGDDSIFAPKKDLGPDDALYSEPLNMRCALHSERLYATSRYVDNLKTLRPDNDNVIFAAIAGVPADLLSDDAAPDFDRVLDDPRMQITVDNSSGPDSDHPKASCSSDAGDAQPPRRLVEVAKAFGADGVLGSLCEDDFGAITGRIIRTVGARLIEVSESAD